MLISFLTNYQSKRILFKLRTMIVAPKAVLILSHDRSVENNKFMNGILEILSDSYEGLVWKKRQLLID